MEKFKVYGKHDEKTLEQMRIAMSVGDAAMGVLCADGHYGYNHPVGGVIGYPEHISISGVGFDIACGNKAIKLDTQYDDLSEDQWKNVLNDISKTISFGVGRINNERVDHEIFDGEEYQELWRHSDAGHLKNMARTQLGTVGSGNHYVDLFYDHDGYVWIGVHFGSRGLGHKITTQYLKQIEASQAMDAPPALLEADSDIGRAYYAGVQLAGYYAYAGRDWVVERVRQIIGGNSLDEVHNNHNFVWLEEHDGHDLWVVRKGATPAFPGERGFVGGSMADDAVIIKGVDSAESWGSMYSTVHGAGRVMSRTDARGKINKKTGEVIREPMVDREKMKRLLVEKGVFLIGADLDEAPQAYRRLPEVLFEHQNTIEIEKVLQPFGVIMAGDEHDPYKD